MAYDKISYYWNERSIKYTNSIEGVLDKSLVKELNLYQDSWMFKQVQNVLFLGKKMKILDIGCGYGRISKKIIDNYPNVIVRGLDIAENYVQIYNSNLEPKAIAYLGNADKLPFKNSSFDAVLMIATLMYITDRQNQDRVVSEISRVLKKNGKVLLIEPTCISSIYLIMGKLMRFIKSRKVTVIDSTIFSIEDIKLLFNKNNIRFIMTSGIPVFSLLLPFLFFLSKINIKLLKFVLMLTLKMDICFAKFTSTSIFV